MIGVRLDGGLGNQLFQYAAARALAARRGTEVRVDVRPLQGPSARRYALGPFDTVARPLDPRTFLDDGTRGPRPLARRARARALGLPTLHVVTEPHFHYAPALADAPDDSYLVGYFQTARYFEDAVDVIRRELTLRAPPSAETARLTDELRRRDHALSIHVRRGDYVRDPKVTAVHGVLDDGYYREAVARVRGTAPVEHAYVFSDEDVALDLDLPTTYVRHNRDRPHEDLALMALARHHIVANSSFSWWGAFLARDGGVRVAPRRWFAGLDASTDDLLDARWVRV